MAIARTESANAVIIPAIKTARARRRCPVRGANRAMRDPKE
jgi:hypothetical protein